MAAPWLGFHLRPIFLAITVVYAAERLVTVRSRGYKVALASAAVVVEWAYDLYLQVVHIRALWGMLWRTQKAWLGPGPAGIARSRA